MWEFIDKVLYINLAKRTDRNEHMKKMTQVFGDKVIRVEATEADPGYIGCTQSHIRCLEMAIENKWKNVLILEDDSEWRDLDTNYSSVEKLITQPYDVLLLCGGCINANNNKVVSSQTATAYLVNSSYYETLLANFKEGFQKLLETNNYSVFAIDQYWKQLQSRDNWYITLPILIYQRPDYSDIEKRYVSYF